LERMRDAGYSWPGMTSNVREFVDTCPTCQRVRDKITREHGETYNTMAEAVMDIVAADTLGPIEEDSAGFRYILVLIDMFSRYIELMPLRTVTAEETNTMLKAYFCRYGCPRQFKTDSGTQFRNELIGSLLSERNIEHVVTTPGNHVENGMVENRMRFLRRLMGSSSHKSYHDFCSQAQYEINSRIHATTGIAPADLMFGDARRLVPRAKREDTTLEDRWLNTTLNMQQSQKRRHQQALTHQQRIVKRGKTGRIPSDSPAKESDAEQSRGHKRQNKRHQRSEKEICEEQSDGLNSDSQDEQTSLEGEAEATEDSVVGNADTQPRRRSRRKPLSADEWVWVEVDQAVKTGRIRRYGPFRISRIKDSIVTYESPTYPGRERTVHISRCHRYNIREGTNPHEEALKYDDHYFVVEAIVNHRFKGKRMTVNNTEVEVKWSGYEETTWEPLKGVTIRRLAAVREYFADKPEFQHLRL